MAGGLSWRWRYAYPVGFPSGFAGGCSGLGLGGFAEGGLAHFLSKPFLPWCIGCIGVTFNDSSDIKCLYPKLICTLAVPTGKILIFQCLEFLLYFVLNFLTCCTDRCLPERERTGMPGDMGPRPLLCHIVHRDGTANPDCDTRLGSDPYLLFF